MSPKMLCVLGCDPELMLSRKGNLISAIGTVPGTKHKPYSVKSGAIQHDNVNLEFNTTPSKTISDFVNNIGVVLKEAQNNIGKDIEMLVRASAEFPDSALQDEEARKFGCDPDFNAWTISVNEVDPDASKKAFRSAGGHVHIGINTHSTFLEEDDGKLGMVKMMDIVVGIPSLLLDKDDSSPARRSLYGRAGCHRPKSYGVEYRALGNFWVKSPELVDLIGEMTNEAVRFMIENKLYGLIKELGGDDEIQRIINESDLNAANKVWENVVSKILAKEVVNKFNKIIDKDYDFYKAWNLR